MRSASDEQEALPLDATPVRDPGARRARRRTADPPASYRLGAELVRTRGWPEGSGLQVDAARRPARGDVVVVRELGSTTAGVFDRRFGRAVLITDRGVAWIGPGADVLGVATLLEAVLDGMPADPRFSRPATLR